MRIVFLITVIIHGLIHILGFLKSFGVSEIKELTSHISKPLGLLWLLCTVLFIIYGIANFVGNKYAWIFGLTAIILSQLLIVWFWKDAKFGTIPNVIILLSVLISISSANFNKMSSLETTQILSTVSQNPSKIITLQEISALHAPVQKWIKTTGIIGKPEIKLGWVKQKALIKLKPNQKDFYAAEALQYSTIENPAFIWTVALDLMNILNIKGRDKFFEGKGKMLIKINSLIPIVNERGKKLDESSMQRYLGEMVWFPSLALSSYITWEEIDEFSAKATMNYLETSGSGTFYFDKNGDFIKFIAMRYNGNEPDSKHYPWVLTVDDYATFEGIKVPSKMEATWKLDKGDWTWLKLEIVEIKYNKNSLP
ncbi:MAG TPA: DUF6544 family protein [Lutibacter sp.]|nr:DUF6544 family protein [Lutibacter sp.]